MNNERREKLLKKIQKLLALSRCESGNLNETAAAAEQAAALMAKYRISEAEICTEDELESDPLVFGSVLESGRVQTWMAKLLSGIAVSNRCRSGIQTGGSKTRLVFFGCESDVAAASYLFSYYKGRIEEITKAWTSEENARRSRRRTSVEDYMVMAAIFGATKKPIEPVSRTEIYSFKLGAAITIAERLVDATRAQERAYQEQAETRAAEASETGSPAPVNALMRLDQLQARVNDEFEKVTEGAQRKIPSYSADKEALKAGVRAAMREDLVGGSGQARGALEAKKEALPE